MYSRNFIFFIQKKQKNPSLKDLKISFCALKGKIVFIL